MTDPTRTLIRILIIEDDEDDYLLLASSINDIPDRKFRIDWCYKYQEALDHISANRYDIYFVDYLLGEKTGLDLIRDAIQMGCEQPIILLTGIGRRELDIEAMTVGAIDYLVKSEVNTEKLERCIRYALERSAYIRALKANERKFRSIFESSKDAVFLADDQLVFRDINDATCELFRLERADLLKVSLYSLFARQEKATLLKDKLTLSGEIHDEEVELMTRSKEKKNCILSVSRQTHSSGESYYQGIIHDITNLKRIERATFQIEKLRSTATLLRTLAHEVRNPLTNINLSVEQLKPEVPADDLQIYLDIIARNCRRIDSIISELLDLSRPAEITLRKIPLQKVLNTVVAAASDRISLKEIHLDLSYPEEPAFIMADAEKLKIAVLNIIINAIEAVPAVSGKISIRIERGKDRHKLGIEDNGGGIPEENLNRIFEPYFTSKTNGFGLGLAAAYNILQAHHASIDVNSRLGEGTHFTLTFDRH